ncbi:MAG TPA: hypothetical protein PLL71_07175 [Agriterribacter sp.]|nr:hypothetical protein [Agriterribacter sp.]
MAGIAKAGHSYDILNTPAKSAAVQQEISNISNGINDNSFVQNQGMQQVVHQDAGAILAARQPQMLIYGVSTRVALDRGLLNISISNRIAELLDVQDNYRANIPDGAAKNQLVQMVQEDINDLEFLWNALFGSNPTCPYISFVGYPAHVNADVKYKDVLSGVGLMREENGIVNFANIPYSEIEGQTKTTELIYKK